MSEDINKLRSDYKELVGRNPFAGWDAIELQKRIDVALAGNGSQGDEDGAAGKSVPVKLLYDVWLKDDDRTPAGATLDLPVQQAKTLIAAGKAERADPLPGEAA